MLTEQQLEMRRTGITATQLPAILGKHPYYSAADVWLEKVAPDKVEEVDNEAIHRGEDLEPAVASWAARELGMEVFEDPDTVRHHDDALLLATPDRLISDGDDAYILECKTSRSKMDWGDEYTDQVPIHYFYQVHHQLDVCLSYDNGAVTSNRAFLAVMWGLDDNGMFTIQYDPELAEMCRDYIHDWWEKHVAAETPPDPAEKNAEDHRKAIARYYSNEQDDKTYIDCTPFVQRIADELYRLQQREEEVHEQVEKKKAQLQQLLGEDYGVEGDFGKIISPTIPGQSRTNWKPIAQQLKKRVDEDTWEQLVESNTSEGQPYRQFRPYWNDEYFMERETENTEEIDHA